MVNITGLIRSNNHLEAATDICNIKGIVAHLRIVSGTIGKLEQKQEDNTITKQEREYLRNEQERLSNSINKIRSSCVCNKK